MRMQDRVETTRCCKLRPGCLAWGHRQVEDFLEGRRCLRVDLAELRRLVRYPRRFCASLCPLLTFSGRNATTPTRLRTAVAQRYADAPISPTRSRQYSGSTKHASIHATRHAAKYAPWYASRYATAVPARWISARPRTKSCTWARSATDEPSTGDEWTTREIVFPLMVLS